MLPFSMINFVSQRYRPDLLQKSFLWKDFLRCRRGPTQRAIVHRTIAFSFSNLSFLFLQNKKDILLDVLFILLLVYTLDIIHRDRYRPDLVQISFLWKEILWCRSVKPSRAALIRAAFSFSNLSALFLQTKNDLSKQVVFCLEVPARFELANNGFADRGLTTWLRYHMK